MSPAALRLLGSLARRRPVVERLLDSLEVDMNATRETLSWKPPFTCSAGLMLGAADLALTSARAAVFSQKN